MARTVRLIVIEEPPEGTRAIIDLGGEAYLEGQMSAGGVSSRGMSPSPYLYIRSQFPLGYGLNLRFPKKLSLAVGRGTKHTVISRLG